jgi:addiction module RelE/StbE family toxin
MSPFEIRYLPTAEKDLKGIFDYILKDNPAAATGLLEKFDIAISHLSDQPHMGVVPNDKRLRRKGYRMLVIGNYLFFHVVKGQTVQIRRIIHGARRMWAEFPASD